jgi:hypothetical protein
MPRQQGGRRVEFKLMAREKRGNPRKSRRARLPSARFTERARFNPSPEQWRLIERPLPVRLKSEDRQALVEIVDAYFGMQPFERAAPHVDDAQAYLQTVLAKARDFWFALQPSDQAAFFAQRKIVKEIPGGRKLGLAAWQEIARLIEEFITAGERATTDLAKYEKSGGFVEGEAWRELIRALTRFCKKRSLPTGASKAEGARPSPFVAFVYELQRGFPERFRRHNFSHAALATAVACARRPPGREIKSGRSAN